MKKLIVFLSLFLVIKSTSQTLSGNCTDNFNATIAFDPASLNYVNTQGGTNFTGSQTAGGSYSIFPPPSLACNDLRQIIIAVEGFDGDNSIGHNDIFNALGSLGPVMTNNFNYHVITLNFNDATNYIERNAFLLVELIKRVNNSKTTNNEIIIIGASMGGLVSRYALSYMEANNIDHECKLFISLDSPHKGATMPFGVQEMLLDFHNSIFTTGPVASLFSILKSPAASQLLRYQIGSGGSAPPNLSTNMSKFFSSIQTLNSCRGYPKECLNMAVSLGALNSNGQLNNSNPQLPAVAGQQAFDYLVPNIQGGNVSTYPASPPFPSNAIVTTCNNSGFFVSGGVHQHLATLPVDIAPGGYSTVFKSTADAISQLNIGAAVNVQVENSCFIPVISAFDYKETDLFYNISSDFASNIYLSKTPFDELCNSNATTNGEHINNVSFSILSWINQQAISVDNMVGACGNFNISLANVTQSSNYIKKAQNNMTLNNVLTSNNIKFIVSAGNEINLSGESQIDNTTSARLFIRLCNSPKACGYTDPNLRPMKDDPSVFMPFTAESYDSYARSIGEAECYDLINADEINNVYSIEFCRDGKHADGYVSQGGRSANTDSNTSNSIFNDNRVLNSGLNSDGGKNLTAYPNPTNGEFKVFVNNKKPSEIFAVSVYDPKGVLIYEESNFLKKDFDLTNYPNGIYLIKVISNLGFSNTKKINLTK